VVNILIISASPTMWKISFLLSAVLVSSFGAYRISADDIHQDPTQPIVSKDENKNVLNVHLVPHTHDDVGWLKTVDQYFYGLNNTIQHASVKNILDSAIRALLENPDRKFTYVEMAFFHKWWELQTTEMQFQVKDLVKRKQLTFVNGGWCMHDEATTHYMGMIDQTTRGHDFLKMNFDGYTPRIGWQLDPFGHSATQASLLSAEAGFDALFFGRIDYEDLQLRQDSKQCEGVWRASPNNLGADGEVFWSLSGSYEGNYQPPRGFDLDGYLSDEPLVDGINIPDRISDFVTQCMKQADRTIGNNIMLTMGSDFQFENAFENFERLDDIVHFVNKYQSEGKITKSQLGRFSSINVFYSNPEMYVDAKSEENIQWQIKQDDFFPYADCENCFWTGYFTSRPLLKRYERTSSSFLHAARQIEAYESFEEKKNKEKKEMSNHLDEKHLLESDINLDTLEDASSIVQHHDGVSGTSKQHVASDYAFRVSQGMERATKYASHQLEQILDTDLEISYCQNLNISSCEVTQDASKGLGTDIFIVAYNALSKPRKDIISVPLSIDATYQVLNLKEETLMESSLLPAPPAPKYQQSGIESAPYLLYFDTGELPPVGAVTYRIRMVNSMKSCEPPIVIENTNGHGKSELRNGNKRNKNTPLQTLEFGNERLRGIFEDGKLTAIHSIESDGKIQVTPIDQKWGYYESFAYKESIISHNSQSELHPHLGTSPSSLHTSFGSARESQNQNSGAYVFRPTVDNKFHNIYPGGGEDRSSHIHGLGMGITHYFQTSILSEVHTNVSPWVHQVIRIKRGSPYVELEYQVGPIPVEDGVGKEIVIKYSSKDINNAVKGDKTLFYTDSNGREFLKRIFNQRESWDYGSIDGSRVKSQAVAGNYYPINAAIYIEDYSSEQDVSQKRNGEFKDDSQPLSLSVLTDRSQGGSSLQPGSIEIMVHRRTVADDARGVDEPIDETDDGITPYPPFGNAERKGEGIQVFGKHRLVTGRAESGASMARAEMDSMFSPIHVFVASRKRSDMTTDEIEVKESVHLQPIDSPFKTRSFSLISTSLPSNVMIITFKKIFKNPSNNQVYLVRVGHQYANGESEELAKSVTVDMNSLFSNEYRVKEMMEKTLSNNKERSMWEATRIHWTKENKDNSACSAKEHAGSSKFLISPMKICTFEVTVEKESRETEYDNVKVSDMI